MDSRKVLARPAQPLSPINDIAPAIPSVENKDSASMWLEGRYSEGQQRNLLVELLAKPGQAIAQDVFRCERIENDVTGGFHGGDEAMHGAFGSLDGAAQIGNAQATRTLSKRIQNTERLSQGLDRLFIFNGCVFHFLFWPIGARQLRTHSLS